MSRRFQAPSLELSSTAVKARKGKQSKCPLDVEKQTGNGESIALNTEQQGQ
jgi:hypothetical protein